MQLAMLQFLASCCNAAHHAATQHATLQRSTPRCNAARHAATQVASLTRMVEDRVSYTALEIASLHFPLALCDTSAEGSGCAANGERSPGADVAGVSAVPAQMRQRLSPVPVTKAGRVG